MKLIELLDGKNEFSCEIVTINWETNYSFEWDEDSFISKTGRKQFKKLLQSEARMIKNGNIVLMNKEITQEELEGFTLSSAGYCSNNDYKLWFEKVKQ